MASHFIAQITEEGGPNPRIELDRASECSAAWIPTAKGAVGWQPSENARCLVFCKTRTGAIEAIDARVLDVSSEMPADPVVADFYADHQFPVWWRVSDVRRQSYRSIDEIPGVSASSGKSARETFSGSQTFAFWSFPEDVTRERPVKETPSGEPPTVGDEATDFTVSEWPRTKSTPGTDQILHGVDFSGGAEVPGQGNSKIWIATWDLGGNRVTLESGEDGDFRRADLPAKVIADKGWWVFDFPFGIAQATAESLGIEDWVGWLNWCNGDERPAGYATLRRDAARTAVEEAGINWSIRRSVDDEWETTWFPLFEQLYRQTIYGASEVLRPLSCEPSLSEIVILPWGQVAKSKTVVLEGFPGVTIRDQLGLPATGYKGLGDDRRNRREEILRALVDWEIPIAPEDFERAVADTEGDAVDALVLLVACQLSHCLERSAWQTVRQRLNDGDRLVEGWFFY